MKASLFAEEDDEGDMFQDQGAMKAPDVSSPRLVLPGAQGRPSGTKPRPASSPSL